MTAPMLPFRESIDDRFAKFDAENPHIYELFKRFTFDAINAGKRHYSADIVLARLRWSVNVETRSGDGLKLNDHYTSRYARKFMAEFPAHAGFFETRKLRAV